MRPRQSSRQPSWQSRQEAVQEVVQEVELQRLPHPEVAEVQEDIVLVLLLEVLLVIQ